VSDPFSSPIATLDIATWRPAVATGDTDRYARDLESGAVLVLPRLAFALNDEERRFLDVRWSDGKAKNISVEGGAIRGARGDAADLEALSRMITRFASDATALVRALFPRYAPNLKRARTSYRPHPASGRDVSWRKDDARLHVDAFPSRPNRGERILRVFSNINPSGQPRVWKVGGSFDAVARRFAPSLKAPAWGSHLGMYLVRMTKDVRTPYDHYMLQLHDRMKADAEYQAQDEHQTHQFAAGSTWMVYTDQVPHAALAGIHQLEQTFYVPVSCMRDEASAPLRVLESVMGRKLA